jgi:predicted RNA-binding Zn ribbon-like protein
MKSEHGTDRLGRVLPDPSWPTGREAAPALEPVRRFLNTVNRENGADRLTAPIGARAWLHAESYPVPARLGRNDVERICLVRDLLHGSLSRDAAQRESALADLDAISRDVPLHVRFGEGVTLESAGRGCDRMIGQVLIAVRNAVADGSWRRLKSCRHCAWVYFDHSKNASGNWCSTTACGARQKAAAYRRRQKEMTHA